MLTVANDFKEENDALAQLLKPLADADFQKKTLFKEWTVNDIVAHLHYFNHAADLSLTDELAFLELAQELAEARKSGETMREFTDRKLNHVQGTALFELWRNYYPPMSQRFVVADPKKRLQWVGPTMSVRSSITARLMETWSHAQVIYDLLGLERKEHDRIKNIVVIGINTFGWTFTNRKETVPEEIPYLRLIAPSGEIWEWHEPSKNHFIEGKAVEFCQVVTQTRNVADTQLNVQGETAQRWMAIAQCFAGLPNDPPAPGTRHP